MGDINDENTSTLYSVPSKSAKNDSHQWTSHRSQQYHDGVQQQQSVSKNLAPVTWLSVPRKGQLALLGLSRVVDFLQTSSFQAYLFFQLKSFDESLSNSEISTQAGILQGAFTAAQFATAVAWGQVADGQWGGRKFVLLVGLLGTAVSCLGVAFSTSFGQAVFWRFFGGAINGTVGVIRTMISENVKEKKYQSRAFLILPISFNIAALVGPVMGGWLSNPVDIYPGLFGTNSVFGGASAVQWLIEYPYSLPMLLNFFFMVLCAALVAVGLDETLETCTIKPGLKLHISKLLQRALRSTKSPFAKQYTNIEIHSPDGEEGLLISQQEDAEIADLEESIVLVKPHRVLPFRRLWTKNVLCTLLAQAFFDFQMGAFNNLWLLFLSTPRFDADDPASPAQHLPFIFTGGLEMVPRTVGLATSILGVIGMTLQFTIYPRIQGRLGAVKSYQYFLMMFPVAYALTPYLSLIPSSTATQSKSNSFWVWLFIIIVLFLQVTARTFTLPASIVLLNNCCPHPSVLGTVHGIGQATSSAFRTIGSVASGWWHGYGLDIGVIGFAWWLVALVSFLGAVAAIFVYEGSGHEIFLPGEEGVEFEQR